MPILRLNVTDEGLELHGAPSSVNWILRKAARGTGPIIIMIHGFQYDPRHPVHNPHTTIFAAATHAQSADDVHWPRHLGFGLGDPDEGLAIAFSWQARGTIWRAQRNALTAGRHLSRAIRMIRSVAPHRPLHLIAHSMGSEVAFEALDALPAGSVQRVITLTGASFQSRAHAALLSPAGQTVELFNITSRENDLFDFAFEKLIRRPQPHDTTMSTRLNAPNALTLQLDCPQTLSRLRTFGGHIAAPKRRICHWSGYARPGALRFYKHLLREPHRLPLSTLKATLPNTSQPRWSRLLALPKSRLALPSPQKATS